MYRVIFFGEGHLRHALEMFVGHYHAERNHQGLGNELIDAPRTSTGDIVRDERLGGLLGFYRRVA